MAGESENPVWTASQANRSALEEDINTAQTDFDALKSEADSLNIKYKDNPILENPKVQEAIKHAKRAGELD